MTDSNQVSKRYSESFVLDNGKLSRILDIIESKFGEKQLATKFEYEMVLSRGKSIKLQEKHDVLSQDNAVKNHVSSFQIEAAPDQNLTEPRCEVRFDDSYGNNISLSVISDDAKWGDQLFAEIEEQLERTFMTGLMYRIKFRGSLGALELVANILGVLAASLAIAFFLILPSSFSSDNNQPEILDLLNVAEAADSTEEKIDFLVQFARMELEDRLPNVESAEQSDSLVSSINFDWLNLRTFFLILPLMILLGSLLYLYQSCYPHVVFLWGDYESHYSEILNRRRTMWTVVIFALLMGIVSSLFVFSLSELI